MSWTAAASAAGSILGGLGGLFGGKKGSDSGREMKRMAREARRSGAEYGFNPLTLLGVGATGATGGGGTAPLASIDLITGGLKDLDDVLSGDAARRRAADELEIDLARLKVEQARSGVVIHRDNAADMVGNSLSPLGRNSATYAPRAGSKPKQKFGMGENPIAPGREHEEMPLSNTSGVFEIENKITGNRPITIPGDSEPWGIDELATAVIVGAPQVFHNTVQGADAKPLGEHLKEKWTPEEGSIADRLHDWWTKDDDKSKKDKK